jgi:hypothetical protein
MARKPKLSYKSRRRWALVLLLIWLPVYVVIAATIMSSLNRAPFVIELLIYVFLGVAWVLPFRFVFRGIGQADPDAPGAPDKD